MDLSNPDVTVNLGSVLAGYSSDNLEGSWPSGNEWVSEWVNSCCCSHTRQIWLDLHHFTSPSLRPGTLWRPHMYQTSVAGWGLWTTTLQTLSWRLSSASGMLYKTSPWASGPPGCFRRLRMRSASPRLHHSRGFVESCALVDQWADGQKVLSFMNSWGELPL